MSGRVVKGTIVKTRVEHDFTEKDELNAIFVVDTLDDGAVKCKHKCWGKHEDLTREVFTMLNLGYPKELAVLTEPGNQLIGVEVDVYVDEYEGHTFGKIDLGRPRGGAALDADAVDAALKAKMGARGNDAPF